MKLVPQVWFRSVWHWGIPCLLLCWLLGMCSMGQGARPAEDEFQAEDVLQFVRQSHRASRDAIQRCQCKLHFENHITNSRANQQSVQAWDSQCWYLPGRVRVRAQMGDYLVDALWKDQVKSSLVSHTRQGRTEVGASRVAAHEQHGHVADAYIRGLLVLNNPGTTRYLPLEEWLDRAASVQATKEGSGSGGQRVRVKAEFAAGEARSFKWDVEVWFDPSVNYLIRKVI